MYGRMPKSKRNAFNLLAHLANPQQNVNLWSARTFHSRLHTRLPWLQRLALPYARLARLHSPTGTLLLAWPSFWSIALASDAGALPHLPSLALFGTGAIVRLHWLYEH